SRLRTGRTLEATPPVLRDRDELLEGGVQLLLARALEPLPQDLEDLFLRPAVDEDDEAEAELLLVDLVQVRELGERDGIAARSLLGGRSFRQAAAADRGMRVERLELLRLAQLADHVQRGPERAVLLREPLDEARVPLEELRELLGAQLPR